MNGTYDLGGYSRPITTRSSAAQRWFDLGLNWRYGFNHEASIASFERARTADPECAMAHWGVAWATGPYYNRKWSDYSPQQREAAVAEANRSVELALALVDRCAPVEQALIRALAPRYPYPKPAELETMDAWHYAHVAVLRDVHSRFPTDLDVAALFAEAMMNRTPWRLWSAATGKPAVGADTEEIVCVLEGGLARAAAAGIAHPGLLHFQVHLMEMSPYPERALLAADRLRHLAPDAGHLLHMPSHIDVQIGRYVEALEASDRAIAADRRYLANEGSNNFYTSSRCHNLHLKIYAAMLAGRWEPAIEAADELAANLPGSLLSDLDPPLSDWLEGYVAMRLHVLIRFGKWRELTREQLPDYPRPLSRHDRACSLCARGCARGAGRDQRGRSGAGAV